MKKLAVLFLSILFLCSDSLYAGKYLRSAAHVIKRNYKYPNEPTMAELAKIFGVVVLCSVISFILNNNRKV